jgi:hypothetical protein
MLISVTSGTMDLMEDHTEIESNWMRNHQRAAAREEKGSKKKKKTHIHEAPITFPASPWKIQFMWLSM